MSQQSATARVAARAPHRRQGPASQPLRVVAAASAKPGNGWFAALCMVLLAAGLVALLMLNTAMAEGSFTLNNLQNTSGELADSQQALAQSIDSQSSPANLAARAAKLGMVPADSAAFLRLSDGKVLGVASAAKPDPGFTVVTAPQGGGSTSPRGAAKPAAAKASTTTTVSKKGAVTTTTTVTTKPDGTVVTTVTRVNAVTRTTTTTTTTTPPRHPAATPTTRTRTH
jgi:hypothetical protein